MGYIKQGLMVLILAVILQKIPSYFQSKLPPVVEGFFLPEFRKVAETFRSFIENGRLKGGSFAVFHKGEVIVDLWGGYADVEAEVAWRNNTVTLVYSTTKGLASILTGLFVEKGWLDYDRPVSYYWPEFGVNGKDKITVKMLMSHQAGLSIINDTITTDMIKNNPKQKEKILEQQTPYWSPGSELAYHGITFGLYVDTLLQKVDPKKRRVDKIFREEIAVPYGIDFMIGAPLQEHYRVARNYPLSAWNLIFGLISNMHQWWMIRQFFDPKSPMILALNAVPEFGKAKIGGLMCTRRGYSGIPKSHLFNSPDMRSVPLSSNMGFGNARSVAKLYGIVANKGKFGDQKIFSDKVVEQLTSLVVSKITKDMGIELSLGRGLFVQKNVKVSLRQIINQKNNQVLDKGTVRKMYNLHELYKHLDPQNIPKARPGFPKRGQTVYGSPGYGGQMAFVDVTNNLGMAYFTNHLTPYSFGDDPNFIELQKTFYECLDRFNI